MNICYLTGKEIIENSDESTCDECASLEHIIPNALGGKIKSKYVLNHYSNQKLNEQIDVEFNKIFEVFHSRLGLKKDREGKGSGSRAYHIAHREDVIHKDGRYYPLKPLYDEKRKVLYANSIKTGENYANKLIKEKVISDKREIEIYDDMAGSINFSFSFDNTLFKKGLAKIAAGFATLKGIKRDNLRCIIDLSKEEFSNNIVVSLSLPTTEPEGSLERGAFYSKHYPIHSLVLCGNEEESFLYCYVELFSTFSYYVLLDDNYDGENIYETYIYDLSTSKEITYSEYKSSIPSKYIFESLPKNYRKIDIVKFTQLNHAFQTNFDDCKSYNHRRFHALAAYTNYVSVNDKINRLYPDQ